MPAINKNKVNASPKNQSTEKKKIPFTNEEYFLHYYNFNPDLESGVQSNAQIIIDQCGKIEKALYKHVNPEYYYYSVGILMRDKETSGDKIYKEIKKRPEHFDIKSIGRDAVDLATAYAVETIHAANTQNVPKASKALVKAFYWLGIARAYLLTHPAVKRAIRETTAKPGNKKRNEAYDRSSEIAITYITSRKWGTRSEAINRAYLFIQFLTGEKNKDIERFEDEFKEVAAKLPHEQLDKKIFAVAWTTIRDRLTAFLC